MSISVCFWVNGVFFTKKLWQKCSCSIFERIYYLEKILPLSILAFIKHFTGLVGGLEALFFFRFWVFEENNGKMVSYYEFSIWIFWTTLLISLVFYWRASKKFIVLSWKKFIGWPIPNHCSGGQHFLPWDKISSLFFTVQPFSEHLNWTNILEVLAIINCNSKFQKFPGFSTKSNCFDEKKNRIMFQVWKFV